MGFFDLNIPYETYQSSKTNRIKLVIKSMELGYTGIAYNRTIKGVMSDHDRCSITPFSLTSLLNIAPSLTSSVHLHRDLLNIPRSSPFRQYTRLTVCTDTPSQCHALNSGNPILKTYDLVAVRPLNQLAFDHACEKSEVNIIAIDFSDKLPFRLKLNMVKAAVERGVYFEITYSDLIVDVQVRRQMISNAKLLVDWTRGWNFILSSAAPSVNELRGPYDVANLSSLLGLPMERAQAAISNNCRNLIANALRKKNFYKETIRVEPTSLDGKSASEETLSMDWLKWDPISSGDGDLQLEDIAKSFSATAEVYNYVKAIDFASVIHSIPSHGASILAATSKTTKVPIAATEVPENLGGDDLLPGRHCNFSSKNLTVGHGSSQDLPNNAATISTSYQEIRAAANTTEEEPKESNVTDAVLPFRVTQKHDSPLQDLIPAELNSMLENQDVIRQMSAVEIELVDTCTADAKVEFLSDKANFLESEIEKSMNSYGAMGVMNSVLDKNIEEMGMKDQEVTPVVENGSGRKQVRKLQDSTIIHVDHNVLISGEMNFSNVPSVVNQENMEEVVMEELEHGNVNLNTSGEAVMEELEHGNANLDTSGEALMEEHEHRDADTEIAVGQDDNIKVKDESLDAKVTPVKEVAMEEQKHEEADIQSNHQIIVPSISGKSKSKKRTPLLFPLKRLLNPLTFKRKSKKFKHKVM